jgi:hypothetical protein
MAIRQRDQRGEVGRGVDGATVIVIPVWPVVNLSPRVGPLVGDDL